MWLCVKVDSAAQSTPAASPRSHTFFAKVLPFCHYGNWHKDLLRGASLQTTPFFLQTGQSCKVDSERALVHVDNRSMWIIDGNLAKIRRTCVVQERRRPDTMFPAFPPRRLLKAFLAFLAPVARFLGYRVR